MALSQTEGDFLTLHELVRAAHKKLDNNTWDYLIGGTATETTLRRNRHALDRLALRPRVLRDVTNVDTSVNLFGEELPHPVLLAPHRDFFNAPGSRRYLAGGQWGREKGTIEYAPIYQPSTLACCVGPVLDGVRCLRYARGGALASWFATTGPRS